MDNITDWVTPKPLVDYSPHGISGFDKEGSPSMFSHFFHNVQPFAQQENVLYYFIFFFFCVNFKMFWICAASVGQIPRYHYSPVQTNANENRISGGRSTYSYF